MFLLPYVFEDTFQRGVMGVRTWVFFMENIIYRNWRKSFTKSKPNLSLFSMLLKHSSCQYLNMIHFIHCGKAVNMSTELEHVVTSLQGCCLHSSSQHHAQFLLLHAETQNFSCCSTFPYFSHAPFPPQAHE